MAQQLTPTAPSIESRSAPAAHPRQRPAMHAQRRPLLRLTERWLLRANETAPTDPEIAAAIPSTHRVRWTDAAEQLANETFLDFWPALVAEPEDTNALGLVAWSRAQANRRLQTAVDRRELRLVTVPVPLAHTALDRLGQHIVAGLEAIGL